MASACGGGAQASPNEPTAQYRVSDAEPIELEVARSGGGFIYISDLRGAPLVLFVFATFDTDSQATMRPLGQLMQAHPELQVLAIAVQPDARRLVPIFEAALTPPFPVAYDATGEIARGETVLGHVGVPMLVVLDSDGAPVSSGLGFHSLRALEALVAPALE